MAVLLPKQAAVPSFLSAQEKSYPALACLMSESPDPPARSLAVAYEAAAELAVEVGAEALDGAAVGDCRAI